MPALEQLPISKLTAHLPRKDLRQMLALVRLLFRLSRRQSYQQKVLPRLPEICRYDPGHAALMMGYDFHLTAEGPRLIEVNTNAGGGYIAWLSEAQAAGHDPINVTPRLQQRLLASFLREWRDFSSEKDLQSIVIVDEDPGQQALYPEMLACRDWLRSQGLQVEIAAPEQLNAGPGGVSCQGQRIDLLYNRHCDFYLESAALAGIRDAYLAGTVCLSPNPYSYGLLADKRRMVVWSDPQQLAELGLADKEQRLLLNLVPHSRLMADCSAEQLWSERKDLIFKPVARFGSRGVLMGKSITRKRFAELPPETTLVQQVVIPSVEKDASGDEYKVDMRLFIYRDQLLGVGARLYQGQVTNLRTPGGGFAPVRLID
jgi:hypothetical protein